MTFTDLKKRIRTDATQSQQTRFFEILRGKPFWIWDIKTHQLEDIRTNGHCCFNHIVGLPSKYGTQKPFFDYERMLYEALEITKHVWIKKATGLGITEFMLRYIAWLCLKDDKLRNSQMCIVTGPRIDLAITLIDRLKKIFLENLKKNSIKSDFKIEGTETTLELNDVRIEAFPSHHLDSMRGLVNVSFILLDEADFFPPGEQQDARDVSERYIAKSDPYIVMVSTPNAPGGLFETIEKESDEVCLYKRLKMDYTYGLEKIYTTQEIEKAKKSPSFEREYNLKYLGLIGNVFHTEDIDSSIVEYDPDDPNVNGYALMSMGIDCGFGSSSFGIVVTRISDDRIQIVFADEFERPDYNEMLDRVLNLLSKYRVQHIYVDGANPEFIRSLKMQIGEESNPLYYNQLIDNAKKHRANIEDVMNVIPVHFSKEHVSMLEHCKMLLEDDRIMVHPKFDKLITALRTAVENGEGKLDKEATSYDDVFDAFRLAMKYYKYED
jgi:hypothetical protein